MSGDAEVVGELVNIKRGKQQVIVRSDEQRIGKLVIEVVERHFGFDRVVNFFDNIDSVEIVDHEGKHLGMTRMFVSSVVFQIEIEKNERNWVEAKLYLDV